MIFLVRILMTVKHFHLGVERQNGMQEETQWFLF